MYLPLPAPFAYARRLVAAAAQSTNPGVICVSKKSFGCARERDGTFFLQASEGCPSSQTGGGLIAWGLIAHLLPLLPRLLWPEHCRLTLSSSPVRKFVRLPPTAFSLFVGPKNPFSAPVAMSIPSTKGKSSGERRTHVGILSPAAFTWRYSNSASLTFSHVW